MQGPPSHRTGAAVLRALLEVRHQRGPRQPAQAPPVLRPFDCCRYKARCAGGVQEFSARLPAVFGTITRCVVADLLLPFAKVHSPLTWSHGGAAANRMAVCHVSTGHGSARSTLGDCAGLWIGRPAAGLPCGPTRCVLWSSPAASRPDHRTATSSTGPSASAGTRGLHGGCRHDASRSASWSRRLPSGLRAVRCRICCSGPDTSLSCSSCSTCGCAPAMGPGGRHSWHDPAGRSCSGGHEPGRPVRANLRIPARSCAARPAVLPYAAATAGGTAFSGCVHKGARVPQGSLALTLSCPAAPMTLEVPAAQLSVELGWHRD
jgi:hypothetical protein